MITDQQTQLQFAVYDQLRVWYNIWYHFTSAMGRAADEYVKTGHINTQVAWEEGAEHLTAIRENIDTVVQKCQFSKEIEQNILMIDTPNKGVFYLNKLAKLINPYSMYRADNYLEHICNAPGIGHSKIVDWGVYNTYQLEVQNFSIAFGRIEDYITDVLSESVWYQQYVDLIKVEGYRSGVVPAANAQPKIIPQLPMAPAPTDQEPEPTEPGVKLQWNCKPAIAGYIISELIRAGYLEPPTTAGDLNYAKLGRTCSQIFEFTEHNATPESWRKVLNVDSGSGNTLPDHKRAKLKLPDLDQLA